jgi:hypothetical protein
VEVALVRERATARRREASRVRPPRVLQTPPVYPAAERPPMVRPIRQRRAIRMAPAIITPTMARLPARGRDRAARLKALVPGRPMAAQERRTTAQAWGNNSNSIYETHAQDEGGSLRAYPGFGRHEFSALGTEQWDQSRGGWQRRAEHAAVRKLSRKRLVAAAGRSAPAARSFRANSRFRSGWNDEHPADWAHPRLRHITATCALRECT